MLIPPFRVILKTPIDSVLHLPATMTSADFCALSTALGSGYIEMVIPTTLKFTVTAYPEGYNYNNSVITSIHIKFPESYGNVFISNTETFYGVTQENGVGFYNYEQKFCGKTVGIMLRKILK